jgi:hypothetical protein
MASLLAEASAKADNLQWQAAPGRLSCFLRAGMFIIAA